MKPTQMTAEEINQELLGACKATYAALAKPGKTSFAQIMSRLAKAIENAEPDNDKTEVRTNPNPKPDIGKAVKMAEAAIAKEI